jgi:aminoglycoside 6'-N-acetyltransferase
MEHAGERRIDFRELRREDFPLLKRWLREPHVLRWWREPFDLPELEEKYGPCIDGLEPSYLFVIECDEQPIGFIQWYRWADYPGHAAKVAAGPGSAGVDLYIGEENWTGKGVGSTALRKFVENVVFAKGNMNAVVSDPEESNRQSVRAFEKAGFRVVKTEVLPGEDVRRTVVRRERNL